MIAFVILIYILRALFLAFVKSYNALVSNPVIGLKIENYLKSGFLFNMIHALVIETQFELIISVYFYFKYLSFAFMTDILSLLITCFAIMSLLSVAYTYFLILRRGKDEVM